MRSPGQRPRDGGLHPHRNGGHREEGHRNGASLDGRRRDGGRTTSSRRTRSGRRLRPRAVLDALRTSIWPLPLAAVLVAALVGLALPWVDRRLDRDPGLSPSSYLFDGGPGAARSVLEAVAGSLITVTSLTFSLTVVTLQLASSQFSPRLLRTFSRDRVVHLTLAMFLATFTYALTVLRSVRVSSEEQNAFVPQLSVSVALALTLASVVALVLFLAHLAREIRVETLLLSVSGETRSTLLRILPETSMDRKSESGSAELKAPASACPVVAESSGFLVEVDGASLVALLEPDDARLVMDRQPGEFVVAGTPLGHVWQSETADGSLDVDQLGHDVADAVTLGQERTSVQDIAFGFRQLTDVALKALSPGINDPTTAVHALAHAAALLCETSSRRLGPVSLHDSSGQPRVLLRRPDLSDLLELVMDPTRRCAGDDPQVLGRLLDLLREVAWSCRYPGARAAVVQQLRHSRMAVEAATLDPRERAALELRARHVEDALDGRWLPAVV